MSFDWSDIVKPNDSWASFNDIQHFEDDLGFDFPDDYRIFLQEHNGGEVIVEHKFRVPEIPYDLTVSSFMQLTAQPPCLGLMEARKLQEASRLCLRQALPIATDGGKGQYFLLLAGEMLGTVFYIRVEDEPTLTLAEWDTWEINVPEAMVEISSSFADFGRLIDDSRTAIAR